MNREFFSKSQGIAVEAQHMHSDGEIEVAVFTISGETILRGTRLHLRGVMGTLWNSFFIKTIVEGGFDLASPLLRYILCLCDALIVP